MKEKLWSARKNNPKSSCEPTLPVDVKSQIMNHYPRMTELARTFPSLRDADGIEPFDAMQLDHWACGPVPSHGALFAARFLLAVWTGYNGRCRADGPNGNGDRTVFKIESTWRCGPFDVVDALGTWDASHRNAFVAWAKEPWYP